MAFHLAKRRDVQHLSRRQPVARLDNALVGVCDQIVMSLTKSVAHFCECRTQFAALVEAVPNADGIEHIAENPRERLQHNLAIGTIDTLAEQ